MESSVEQNEGSFYRGVLWHQASEHQAADKGINAPSQIPAL
jgi:hypothetical protein